MDSTSAQNVVINKCFAVSASPSEYCARRFCSQAMHAVFAWLRKKRLLFNAHVLLFFMHLDVREEKQSIWWKLRNATKLPDEKLARGSAIQ